MCMRAFAPERPLANHEIMAAILSFRTAADRRPAMSRRKSPPPHTPTLRRHIAAAAARLMAEDGIGDYGMAKRKAARQLGIGEKDALPSNDEVEEELREYLALYQDDEHADRLVAMRQAALAVMAKLVDYHPCLTGAVLDGTAGRYSAIELDLFADSSKDVEIFLLSSGISYEVDDIQWHGNDVPETRLQIEWDGFPVNLLVFPLKAERNVQRNPHSGRNRARAQAPALAALLAEGKP